jgi:hypothetical protein
VITAHVGGVPLEEIAPAVAGAGLLLGRASLIVRVHLRRRREPGR